MTDPRCGRGREFRLGEGQLTLEVYPGTSTTRLTTPTARLELVGPLALWQAEGGVVFTRQEEPDEDVHVALRPMAP